MKKYKFLSYVIIFLVLIPATTLAQTASSTADLQALIKQLQAQIAELQAQVQSIKTELKITRALAKGATGDDVKQLQEFLKTIPGVYPEGLVTGYFGPLTEQAVRRLQEKEGIEAIGIVGPRTTAKLNELITQGAGKSGTIPPGLLTAPGIQGAVVVPAVTTTTTTTTTTTPTATAPATADTSSTSGGATAPVIAPTQQTTTSVQSTPTTSTATTTSGTTTTINTTSTSGLSAPLNFRMTGAISGVFVYWSAVNSTSVAGYKVFLTNTDTNTLTTYKYATSTIGIGIGGLATGNYSAYVVTYDAAENISAPSTSASATVTAQLTAPANFSVSAFSPIFVGLTWSASQGSVSYYTIDRNTCNSCGAEATFEVSAPATSYNDFTVKSGTAYTYRIRAIGTDFGNQSDTVFASVTTPVGTGSSEAPSSATTSLRLTNSQMANVFTALAQTDPSLIIKQLQEQIKVLQAQVEELKTQIVQVKSELNLTRSLSRGLSGDDVKQLQTFLSQKYPEFYSAPITGYFGPLTEQAVRRLQEKEGIEAVGIVGPRTTARLNELVTQGAGKSEVVPPGLLTAPGIQGSIAAPAVTTSTTPSTTTAVTAPTTSIAPSTSVGAVVPVTTTQQTTTSVQSTTSSIATTTTTATTTSATSDTTSNTTTTSGQTNTETSARKMFNGANGDGWGSDDTFCLDSNYSVSMWSDVAGTCQDKAGTYTDVCQAPPYEWRKTNYSCTGDVSGTTWTNVRCTTSNSGFVGGSCSAGVISPTPPPPSSTTSTTSSYLLPRSQQTANILEAMQKILNQMQEFLNKSGGNEN